MMTHHPQTDAKYQIVILEVYQKAKCLHHDTDGFAAPVTLKSSGMLVVPVPFIMSSLTRTSLHCTAVPLT